MAGLEVVVRPVVFPNIRPAPARSLPLADDPEKGFCVIKGNGAKQVNLSYSFTWTFSKSKMVETKRRVDEQRVYQKEKDGTVNKNNYVDVDVANKIWSEGGQQPTSDMPDPGAGTPGVGAGTPGVGTETPGVSTEKEIHYYQPAKEKDNIEILKRDVIKESDR